MDLLFQRYASPLSLMDGMLRAGSFVHFIEEFVKTINHEIEMENEDKIFRIQWEFWLLRVHDMSFDEYRNAIETDKNMEEMTASDIETTVQDSLNILKNFTPNKEKGGE